MYKCMGVQVYKYMSVFVIVQVYKCCLGACTSVYIHGCVGVQMCRCTSVWVYNCTGVHVFRCPHVYM